MFRYVERVIAIATRNIGGYSYFIRFFYYSHFILFLGGGDNGSRE
jgi:hypothetical protein